MLGNLPEILGTKSVARMYLKGCVLLSRLSEPPDMPVPLRYRRRELSILAAGIEIIAKSLGIDVPKGLSYDSGKASLAKLYLAWSMRTASEAVRKDALREFLSLAERGGAEPEMLFGDMLSVRDLCGVVAGILCEAVEDAELGTRISVPVAYILSACGVTDPCGIVRGEEERRSLAEYAYRVADFVVWNADFWQELHGSALAVLSRVSECYEGESPFVRLVRERAEFFSDVETLIHLGTEVLLTIRGLPDSVTR